MSTHAKKDQISINDLIESNLGLIPQIAGSYIKNGYRGFRYHGYLTYEEVCSVVKLALVECAYRYDPEKAAFNSYVTTIAKYNISRAEQKEAKHINHTIPVEDYELEVFVEQYATHKPEDPQNIIAEQDRREYLAQKVSEGISRRRNNLQSPPSEDVQKELENDAKDAINTIIENEDSKRYLAEKLLPVFESEKPTESIRGKHYFKKVLNELSKEIAKCENKKTKEEYIKELKKIEKVFSVRPECSKEPDIKTVILMLENGFSQRGIARVFGVAPHNINKIVNKIRSLERQDLDVFQDTFSELDQE